MLETGRTPVLEVKMLTLSCPNTLFFLYSFIVINIRLVFGILAALQYFYFSGLIQFMDDYFFERMILYRCVERLCPSESTKGPATFNAQSHVM